jgi:hypothetical protein
MIKGGTSRQNLSATSYTTNLVRNLSLKWWMLAREGVLPEIDIEIIDS